MIVIKPVVVVVVLVVVVIHNLFSVSIFLQMICMGIQTYFSTSNREVVGVVIVVVVVQEVRKKKHLNLNYYCIIHAVCL